MLNDKKAKKVPLIMQMEALECGAASLAMILAYHGKWLPLERVRADCGISRDGSNAKNLVKAAKNYGLSAKAYKLEPEEIKKSDFFPCIIHWNFNHFVVLCGFKGNDAIINDPSRGTYTASWKEFDESFTGICLYFEKGENFIPSGKPKSILSFAKKRLVGAKSAILFIIIATLIASILGIINLSLSKEFMDTLLVKRSTELIKPLIAAMSVFAFAQITVLAVKEINSYKINGKFAAVSSTNFMWKIFRMPMDFFSQRMAGDIQLRASSNEEIAGIIVNTLAPILLNAIMMIIYLAVMVRYSLVLTLIGVISVVINLIVCSYVSKKRTKILSVLLRDEGKLAATTVSGIDMIESIKASGAENSFFEKWSGYQASVNKQNAEYTNLEVKLGFIPDFVTAVTEIAVLAVGVALVIQGRFTEGSLLAFQGFLTAFTKPANQLINAGQLLQEMKSDAERIEDVMEYAEDDVLSEVKQEEYDKLSGEITLKNVTFGYSPLSEPIIRDFNMTVKPGQKIAIVGSSGCGKSTVAKLISGLYKPWSGEILFDGKSVSEIDSAVFSGSLAVVDQDVILFEDTIANNIKMWDSSIEDFEMIMAARDAQIHEEIIQRNGGYNYKIYEGGKDFSGGQKQRLEIARVLAQDPTIIIMDEATSALDAKTEYDVVKSISDRGITTIVVAHRLSTIRDCDEIIVLDKGVTAERGTHEELYAKDGIYKKLISNE